MKYAVIFALAAFAFLAQADARFIAQRHTSVNRGAVVQAVKSKLTQTKEKLGTLVQDAQAQLKNKIAQVQKQVELLIDQLSEKTTKISSDVFEAVEKVLDKADKFEDQIVEQAKNILNKYGFKGTNKSVESVTPAEQVSTVESVTEQ